MKAKKSQIDYKYLGLILIILLIFFYIVYKLVFSKAFLKGIRLE